MGGITNYYHGESGLVTDSQRVTGQDQEADAIRLEGNPHREFAFDYGADVGIDPLLMRGDRAIFVRVDEYTGMWVREGMHYYPEVGSAIERVMKRRRAEKDDPRLETVRLHGISTEQYVADSTKELTGSPFLERPATDVSFFLSFSSTNVLVARQIYSDLKYDARVEVWFDLDQAGESSHHVDHISDWLRDAVYRQRGFILLWTRAAANSHWVSKEIVWALERSRDDSAFRFIILKLDDTPLPGMALGQAHIIDCFDLWPVHGINEELFAAAIGRSGRISWLEEHRSRSLVIPTDEGNSGYDPFVSDSGKAEGLRFWREDGELNWELKYRTPSGLGMTAVGRGLGQAVDLGIRPGDYVGYYICHRAARARFWPGVPIWMRSADLKVRPEDTVSEYLRYADPALELRSLKGAIMSWQGSSPL